MPSWKIIWKYLVSTAEAEDRIIQNEIDYIMIKKFRIRTIINSKTSLNADVN